VTKFNYGVRLPLLRSTLIPLGKPERGDIIVFIYPEDRSKDFIKRTVGLPGDTIEIKDKKVFINGLLWNDANGTHVDLLVIPGAVQPRDNFGPVTVPEDSYFVMGDNRDESYDSRFWGFVRQQDILGKALIIYWSWDSQGHSLRWKRVGKIIN
jgi:signal peptidase I